MISKKQQQKNLSNIINNEYLGGSFIGDLTKYPLLKTFQALANAFRLTTCGTNARMLKKGEIHPFCFNFMGPGTDIKSDKVRNQAPINAIDSLAKTHDLSYYAASFLKNPNDIKKAIRDADNEFLKNIEQHKNVFGYTLGKMGIEGKMSIEKTLPLVMSEFLIGRKHMGGILKN